MEHLATNLASSGLFKDSTQAAQAFAKVLIGRDMGLSASAAMMGLHIVEGKPELSANLQAQLVNTYRGPDGERYRFRVAEHTSEVCSVEFFRRERIGDWESLGVATYSIEDAKIAGLLGRGPWKKHPRNMLWARAMSDGVNFFCPEVARGLRAYHEGEISSEPAEQPPLPTAPPAEEPEVVDAEVIELVSDEQAAALLDGCQTLANRGVKCGTVLVAAGAHQGRTIEETIRSLPASAVDEVAGWLSATLDRLDGPPVEPAMTPGEAVAEGM